MIAQSDVAVPLWTCIWDVYISYLYRAIG